MKGTVKFYNRMKRFGFVTGEDEVDYFVHESAIADGLRLDEGVVVEFDPADGDRGKKAENVRAAEEDSTEE